MPRSAIRSAVWILTLLFRLTVTENQTCLEQNVLLEPRENRLVHGSSGNFWEQSKPPRENESIETVGTGLPNKILQLQATGNINLKEGYKNVTVNGRTLMDYNSPIIMEDFADATDQDLTSHVRVKRNEPNVRRRSVKLIDSFSRNSRTDATSTFGNSTFEESRSENHESRSAIVVDPIALHLRRKRGVLPKSRYHRKRVKGNVGHSKHHVEIRNGNKKHGMLKSSPRPTKKKMKNPDSKGRSKHTREIGIPAETIDESRIEKRESENSDLNTNIDTVNIDKAGYLISKKESALLTNNRSLDEPRKENTVTLPFVHKDRAELRVRFEKLPTNESSLTSSDHWTNCSVGTSSCSIVLPKYKASDQIFNINVTNLELAPYFDSIGRRRANNLTMKSVPKKLDHGNDASVPETSDPERASFYNVKSLSIKSNVSRIEDDRSTENKKYDRTNEVSAGSSDDEKSRAKRNEEKGEITSKRYLRSDKIAKGSRRFKDAEQGTSVEGTMRRKTKYKRTRGNRAVRSIEEIKDLAEKLVVKINELQIYVSNRNETLYATESCLGEDADRAEQREIALEKDISTSSTSEIAKNVNKRQRFAKEAALAGKGASQVHLGGSRFARGEYQTRRSRRKWGRWMDWSSCSVTCGKGRQIRWRHCLHGCDAETEMEEKACQLPACPPSKFLGIF